MCSDLLTAMMMAYTELMCVSVCILFDLDMPSLKSTLLCIRPTCVL